MTEDLAQHMGRMRGIEALPSDDAAPIDGKKVNRAFIVVDIDLLPVGAVQIPPAAFFDEDVVPQSKVLSDLVFVG
jgi:hypothetical protein